MLKQGNPAAGFEEHRSEPRKEVDDYYSVEFSTKETAFLFQFKIWNVSSKGMCIIVKQDSLLLNHIHAGDILEMNYYPADGSKSRRMIKTEIKYINKDENGKFKDHYLVGLSILDGHSPSDEQ